MPTEYTAAASLSSIYIQIVRNLKKVMDLLSRINWKIIKEDTLETGI